MPLPHPSHSVRCVIAGAWVLATLTAGRLDAQGPSAPGSPEPLTRTEAVARALRQGPHMALAGAVQRAAAADLRVARAASNPLLTASYSQAVPQYHASIEFPLDLLWLRGPRVAAAQSAAEAAIYRLAFDRAAIETEVDTLYTLAAAARAHAALSGRNAAAADSLVTIAARRREAGDASDLDVELARVSAGQARNQAVTDSLSGVSALLDLQASIGLVGSGVTISLADSLLGPDSLPGLAALVEPGGGEVASLRVAAAERDLQAAEHSVALARRGIWSGIAATAGLEGNDPTGSERGVLPTVGLSIPVPLFSRHGGEIAQAEAARDRAAAELATARLESATRVGQVRGALRVAAARAQRDAALVSGADRVARLSLRAYAEGALPLASVLEAQRNAREALARLIDDVAATETAAARLRLLTTQPTSTP